MSVQYLQSTHPVCEHLIERIAEEVRLEIQRRKVNAGNSFVQMDREEMNMPIVLRGRSSSAFHRWVFRSSRLRAS